MRHEKHLSRLTEKLLAMGSKEPVGSLFPTVIPEAAIEATRRMNLSFPGGLDGALWEIGCRWCFTSKPNCVDCPLSRDCARRWV